MEIDMCFWLFPTNDRYITQQRDISIKRGNINTMQSFVSSFSPPILLKSDLENVEACSKNGKNWKNTWIALWKCK